VTLSEYLLVFRRRWRLLVAALLLGTVAGSVFAFAGSKKYTATSRSFVTLASNDTAANGSIYQGSQFAVQQVQSYTRLATSPSVLEPVITKLKLDTTVEKLSNDLTATSPTGTVLLDVTVTRPDATQAAAISNTVSAQLASMIQALETPAGQSQSNVRVTLTNPARVPTSASSPKIGLDIAVGFVVGLALGLILCVIREQLDGSVRTSSDVKAVTGSSPLGTVLHRDRKSGGLAASQKGSARAEAYRTIRTNLQLLHDLGERKRIVLTSPTSFDGKTATTCNIAVALAQTGNRVCLVEADFRNPTAAKILGVSSGSGLSDVVSRGAALDEVIASSPHAAVSVLPAGPIPADPNALLGSTEMKAVLAELSERFDIVLLDAPATLAYSDAEILINAADGAIIVCSAGKTSRNELRAVIESVQDIHGRVLGTVLIGDRTHRRRNTPTAPPSPSATVASAQPAPPSPLEVA
jgi:succinoglycan biosynthesis transport protein ExoP